MSYREPRLEIKHVFEQSPSGQAQPLAACQVGPSYVLHRYSESDERAQLADYDRDVASQIYAWPNHVAGGLIDLDNAIILLEGGLLEYYQGDAVANLTDDNNNRLTSATLVFVSTANGGARSAEFGDRDVKVGDKVILTWFDTGESLSKTFTTEVVGFDPTEIPGTSLPVLQRVADATYGNTTEGATESIVYPSGDAYDTVYNTAAYNGLTARGIPSDEYTIRVQTVGTGGNGFDGTVLLITSVNGEDYTHTVVPGDWDTDHYNIPLGADGAILELDPGTGTPLVDDFWRVTISQDYTQVDVSVPAEIEVTGQYTGGLNTQYVIEVTDGGVIGTDDVVLLVKTNNGQDIETTITAAAGDFGGGSATYALGIRGLDVELFDTTQYAKGDVIVFDAEAAKDGTVQTLILRDNIPAEAAFDMDVQLLVEDTYNFPTAFSNIDQNQIEIIGNAQMDSTLLGTSQLMRLFRGTLYADYRELDTANVGKLGSIADQAERAEFLGPDVVENPLSLAVSLALQNSDGEPVYYCPVGGNDDADYEEVLEILTEDDIIYSMVPLTDNEDVKQTFFAHVVERSDELNNQWRIAWVWNDTQKIQPVYTELSGGGDILATVEEYNPGQFNKVVASGALFEVNEVAPGDTLRINFSTDAQGNVTYDEYTIDQVLSETELVLLGGLLAPIAVGIKAEIWKTLDRTEYATSLGQYPAAFNHRRVYSVWGDNPVTATGEALPGYFVCAALAGLRSGSAPHAPLSQIDLAGVFFDPQEDFSRTQLNTIASGGNWLVVKDRTGRVFTRHQVSSIVDPNDFLRREQSKTTNLDHISRDIIIQTKDIFGQSNISEESLNLIEFRIESMILSIQNRVYPAKIGRQMLDARITKLERDPLLRDVVLLEIEPDMPDPLNGLPIVLKIR